jgi:hypothetical protein
MDSISDQSRPFPFPSPALTDENFNEQQFSQFQSIGCSADISYLDTAAEWWPNS